MTITRKTRKAGLLKPRINDPQIAKTFDQVIERLEVLDGLRGDELDRAVTMRDLYESGFRVSYGGGTIGLPGGGLPGSGGPIGGVPPSQGYDDVGPANAPTGLTATETFLALLLSWTSGGGLVQHFEIWRADTDNLSLAVYIGSTVSTKYVDYVGAEATYYYWVRAVGTDGTFSPFNDTAGTLGTTGVDPSSWEANITVSTAMLDAQLGARIDLVDDPTTGLVIRMDAVEGDVVSLDTRTDTLESSVSGLTTTVNGNTSSINANATNISTNSTQITVLDGNLSNAQQDILDNAASITANSQSIQTLEATIGAIDTSGGQDWEFNGTDENFTTSNASISISGSSITWTPSGSDPQLISEQISPTLSGGIYTQVVMRVRRTGNGGTWEGHCYYETPSHGYVTAYRKQIAEPDLPLNTWKVITWDMNNLTEGGSDWVNSEIESLRFDLVSDNGGQFEIDYILIAKFSTTAISEAISALDVRVTLNEGNISSQATAITNLQATVEDPSTGVFANAAAISGLTTDVSTNQGNITSNASAISALQTTVNDPTSGVTANAGAIVQLEADVSILEGTATASASSITQLIANLEGGTASFVNPLTVQGDAEGTTFLDAEVQNYSISGRVGTAGIITTSSNATRTSKRWTDNTRIYVPPFAIYEVRASFYHARSSTSGRAGIGFNSYTTATGGSAQGCTPVINRQATDVVGGDATPEWIYYQGASQPYAEWIDCTFYILGSDVAFEDCPRPNVNGETSGATITDGFRVESGDYIELVYNNFNSSPLYGDGSQSSLYVTDVSITRKDGDATNYSVLQQGATVTANDVGDLQALYYVQAELNSGGYPYISGFGLSADVVNGVASSAFGIFADDFFIAAPTYAGSSAAPGTDSTSVKPFAVQVVEDDDGNTIAEVGIDGNLIVTRSIRGSSIVAGTISAGEITVENLAAFSTDTGTLRVRRMTTGNDGTAPDFLDQTSVRTEIEGFGNAFPFWFGSGPKDADNARFYLGANGDVVIKGLLNAGMIAQSYFAPAIGNNSFRIACNYPSQYLAGVYTGRKAHLMPTLTTGLTLGYGEQGVECYDRSSFSSSTILNEKRCGYQSEWLYLYNPNYGSTTSTIEYGRLGTYSENLNIRHSVQYFNAFGYPYHGWAIVEYQYSSGTPGAWEPIRRAYINYLNIEASSGLRLSTYTAENIFVTRSDSWNRLRIRLAVGATRSDEQSGSAVRAKVMSCDLAVTCVNMGYADQSFSQETGVEENTTTPTAMNLGSRKMYL